jgi:hypothetical protein
MAMQRVPDLDQVAVVFAQRRQGSGGGEVAAAVRRCPVRAGVRVRRGR